MKRRDFYYRQLVGESDLDEVFDLAEEADHNITVDNGIIGITDGLEITEANTPNLTVECDAGVAYDQDGQRCYVSSTQTIDVSVDSDNVSTDVSGEGNIKWVSVFIQFDRALSNPKTDGNNATVQYNRDESFTFIVEQSSEDVAPNRPALKSDAILLADIQRSHGVNTIEDAQIDTTRRQWAFKVSAGDYSIAKGTAEEAVGEMLTIFNTYASGGAASLAYDGGGAWADGTTNPATTVEAQLDKIITDLGGTGGAAKIGVDDTATLEADTVQAALTELDTKKGGLASSNTWSGLNTYSNSVAYTASGSDRTITRKLTTATSADEITVIKEAYGANISNSEIVLDTPPDGHISRYDVEVIGVIVGDLTKYFSMRGTGTVSRSGGTVTVLDSDWPTEFRHQSSNTIGVGAPAFDTVSTSIVLSVFTHDPMSMNANVRIIIRRHSVSI